MSELLRDLPGTQERGRARVASACPSSAALGRPSAEIPFLFRTQYYASSTSGGGRRTVCQGSRPLPVAKCKRLKGLATQARRNIAKVNADFQRAA